MTKCVERQAKEQQQEQCKINTRKQLVMQQSNHKRLFQQASSERIVKARKERKYFALDSTTQTLQNATKIVWTKLDSCKP
jgi:hypothetical protein